MLSKVIKAFRLANNYTVNNVSNLTGLSSIYISELERGVKKNASFETISKLAKGFNVTPTFMEELLKYSNVIENKYSKLNESDKKELSKEKMILQFLIYKICDYYFKNIATKLDNCDIINNTTQMKGENNMQLISQDDKKKIYVEKGEVNKIYTLLDMGEYVGLKNREWYEKPTPYWMLMYYEELSSNNQKRFSVKAINDTDGNYMQLALEQDGIVRKIKLQNNKVLSDIVYDNINAKYLFAQKYVGYDNEDRSKEMIDLKDYLSTNVEYISSNGKTIKTYPKNEKVIDFITANENFIRKNKVKQLNRAIH